MDISGVGLIGAGAIAGRHVRSICATPGLDLRMIANRTLDRAVTLAGTIDPHPEITTDVSALIARPAIDIIVIAYPTQAHGALIQAAFAAGKDVVCEKPLVGDHQAATAILTASTAPHPRLGRAPRLVVCHIRRYWEPFALLHDLMGVDAPLGACIQATWTFWGRWAWTPSWRTEQTGGYLLDAHVHEIDLLHWLTRTRPQTAYGLGVNTAEGGAIVLIESNDGAQRRVPIRIEWSGDVPHHEYPAKVTHRAEFVCSNGWARLTTDGPTLHLEWMITTSTTPQSRSWTFASVLPAAWQAMWQDFAHHLRTGAPPRVNLQDAADAVAVALAANRSLQTRQVERVWPTHPISSFQGG